MVCVCWQEGVHCVVYQLTEYRVIEEVTTTTTSVGKSRAVRRTNLSPCV